VHEGATDYRRTQSRRAAPGAVIHQTEFHGHQVSAGGSREDQTLTLPSSLAARFGGPFLLALTLAPNQSYHTDVHEYSLFLRALAERVYTARLSNGSSLQDATDFREWMIECAEKAATSTTIEELFSKIDQ
jgi:hypothetical protein